MEIHRVMGFFSSLFRRKIKKHPQRDDVVGIRDSDEEFKAARERAMATLRGFVEAVQRPEEGKRYLLKVELAEGNEVEHVWLEPVKWLNPGLAGVLAVEPLSIKKHKRGDVIAPRPSEISDWVIIAPDGSKIGGFTMDAMDGRRK